MQLMLPLFSLQDTVCAGDVAAAAAATAAASLLKHAARLEALPHSEASAAVDAVKALAAAAAAAHTAIAAAVQSDAQPQRRRTPAEVAALLQDAAGGPLAAGVERSSSAPVVPPSATNGVFGQCSSKKWSSNAQLNRTQEPAAVPDGCLQLSMRSSRIVTRFMIRDRPSACA